MTDSPIYPDPYQEHADRLLVEEHEMHPERFRTVTPDARQSVNQYFTDHPESRDGVLRAFYAYHAGHPKLVDGAHEFGGPSRVNRCAWCGRSREEVRWDSLPPRCSARPEFPDIADVLDAEETKANALLERAKAEIPRLISRMGLGGNTLAVLHHTHGYDPETVSGVIEIPTDILKEYHTMMESERRKSRDAVVREVIIAQPIEP